MPNSCHVPVCPFYVDEKRKSISCEDVFRSFKSTELKHSWMEIYCDSWEWQKCPYARDLAEAYARFEEGDITALEEHKIEAMKKEMKSLSTKLGRAEKRIARQQKKIDELRAVNQSFTNVNDTLYKKWRDADSTLAAYEKNIAAQIQKLADSYEVRLAYMVDKYEPFSEEDVEEWAKDKSFALVYADGGKWNVKFKEEESEDGKHEPEAISGDDRNEA